MPKCPGQFVDPRVIEAQRQQAVREYADAIFSRWAEQDRQRNAEMDAIRQQQSQPGADAPQPKGHFTMTATTATATKLAEPEAKPATPLRADQVQAAEHWTGQDLCLIWEASNGEFKTGPQSTFLWNPIHSSRYVNGGSGLQRGQTIKVFSREDSQLLCVAFVAGISGTPQTGLSYLNLAEAWSRSGAPEPAVEQALQGRHRFRFAGPDIKHVVERRQDDGSWKVIQSGMTSDQARRAAHHADANAKPL